jgi:hypothetical protein
MRPANSAYRDNVKAIQDFLTNNNIRHTLGSYSKDWIGCEFSVWLIDNGKPDSIEISCGSGEFVEDGKARPYYFIVHDYQHYEAAHLKQIYEFFNKYKECGIRSACEYVQKNTDIIKEQLKITKDFV